MGNVTPRLREARAMEGEDSHYLLNWEEELLLKVGEVVQGRLHGAEGDFILGTVAPAVLQAIHAYGAAGPAIARALSGRSSCTASVHHSQRHRAVAALWFRTSRARSSRRP